MADHGARAHATWSASATARNWHCAGALALAQTAPPQKESIHAARGTACHQIAEKCLRTGVDASSFLDTVEKTKARDIVIDEELVNSAQEYIDYCRDLMSDEGAMWWIEERFSLADLGTPFDAGGTGDFVFYDDVHHELEIVDLKNGMGVVDPKENPQLRTYALGAMLAHQDLDVENVKVTIVQPRAPHPDGRIRSETFSVADLIEWTADLLAAMKRSKQAADEYAAVNGNSVKLDEWAAKWLQPGKCTFCPVEATCPAYRRDALQVAAIWFDDMDEPRLGNSALDNEPEALSRDLKMIPMLEDWIKARRAYAHAQAESGVDIPGFQLVDRIGNRKWGDEEGLLAMLRENGVEDSVIYTEPRIQSVAQLEKRLTRKEKLMLEPFIVRESNGTNLVSVEKTTRPAAKSVAAKYFEAN